MRVLQWAALLIWSLCNLAVAEDLDQCGQYDLEGYLTLEKGSNTFVVTVDKRSDSELRFDLGKLDASKYNPNLDTNVRVRVEVREKCDSICAARLIELKKSFDPFYEIRSSSAIRLQKEMPCL